MLHMDAYVMPSKAISRDVREKYRIDEAGIEQLIDCAK
jgi:hypothetical protein